MQNYKRPAIIDTHCHYINLNFIPDEVVRTMTPMGKKFCSSELFEKIISLSKSFIFCQKPFLKEYFKILNSSVNQILIEQKNEYIDIHVPLMLDLYYACIPYNNIDNKLFAYSSQIQIFSEITYRNPWKIFPFIMFDPRRHNSDNICIEALEKYGFFGIKLYPAIGYNPLPENNSSIKIQRRLNTIYQYCAEKNIPITSHTSVKGVYFTKYTEEAVWKFTEVSNWKKLLEHYPLKINFAHFGGNYLNFPEITKRSLAKKWRLEILKLMKEYNSRSQQNKIYTDISYHYMALRDTEMKETHNTNSRDSSKYFNDLNKILSSSDCYKRHILFGTDSPMINHSWTSKSFTEAFMDIKNLSIDKQILLFNKNPVEFLFKDEYIHIPNSKFIGYKIPESYIKFLNINNPMATKLKNLPDWVYTNDEKEYYLVAFQ